MAAAQDFDHWLDERESYVVPKNVPSSHGRKTYVHSNIRQYINEILIKEGQERQQLATVRAQITRSASAQEMYSTQEYVKDLVRSS